MPQIRNLDPNAGPLFFLGAELRRARMAAGLSQDQLGQRIGYSGAQVGKVETGERPPSLEFVQGCDRVLPNADGLFERFYELAQRWPWGVHPAWFAEWLEAERRAMSLSWWEALLVPGLLQTEDYARAIVTADPDAPEDETEELVAARLERQAIFDQPRPPALCAVIDEAVLHRLIGSHEIMRDQLLHLADMSERPNITVQVVPAGIGAHAGLLGGFALASAEGFPDTGYMETPAQGQTSESPSVARKLTRRFSTLRADALPRAASRDLIRKAAEQWSTT